MLRTQIDDYLSGIPADKRGALERLRSQIQAVASQANETINYGMPAFRLHGHYIVGFAATRRHCSFYVGRGPLEAFSTELAGLPTWKGTINFAAERPIPGALVDELVRCRLAQLHAA